MIISKEEEQVVEQLLAEYSSEGVASVFFRMLDPSPQYDTEGELYVHTICKNTIEEREKILSVLEENIVSILRKELRFDEGYSNIDKLGATNRSSHYVGAYMARLIETTLGHETIRHSHDPILFFENYNEAAAMSNEYVFGNRFMDLIRKLKPASSGRSER